MRVGAFVEPSGPLKANILDWKKRINSALPMQPYCSHPPHCTLIHTEVSDATMAIAEITKNLRSFPAFDLYSEEAFVFWKDSATGGGHTLVWKLLQNKQLHELQLLVAKALIPYSNESLAPDFVQGSPLLSKSFELFGFPFVGDHWIPHMTIASLRVDSSDELITAFLDQSESFEMKIDEVSFWHIQENEHTLLGKVGLQ